MWAYILRRLLLTIPIVFGVLLLTFSLFSLVSTDPARAFAGRNASEETVAAVRAKMGLDKPRFFNLAATTRPVGVTEKVTGVFDSQFFDLAFFRFPQSMRYNRDIWDILAEKAPVSLAIQLPAFLICLGLQLGLAVFVAARRGSTLDYVVTFVSVAMMSVATLSLYIALQWLLAARLGWFPVAGWESGVYAVQYAALPILSAVIITLGPGVRFYRTVILEEINQDYVRTARAKGVPENDVLLVHVLRNVMIPVVTNTVTALPFLVFGAIIMERLFQIPGLGGLLVEAIFSQDRSVVMAITYITALMYCAALLLSDILYTVADPRVSLS
jgi:peptide/nickel transport system permease protein